MNGDQRFRRPALPRSQPIRNWSTLFGGPAGAPAPPGASGRPGDASVGDAISRSVALGYRVVDEYLQQGQRAAQRLADRSYGPANVAHDVQDVTARMVRYPSGLLATWVDFLQVSGGAAETRSTAAETNGAPGASPDGAAYAAPVGQATRVRLEVVTSRVVTVSVELAPEAATRPATAHALRSADQDKPRLTEVSLRPDAGGPAVLRVCVPDDQPAGVYSGLVVDDEASRLVGTINVRIGGSPDDERSRPTPP